MHSIHESRTMLMASIIAVTTLLLFSLILGAVLLVQGSAGDARVAVPTATAPKSRASTSTTAAPLEIRATTVLAHAGEVTTVHALSPTSTSVVVTSRAISPSAAPGLPHPAPRPSQSLPVLPHVAAPTALLAPPTTAAVVPPDAVVLAQRLNLHAGPGPDHPVLLQLSAHDRLTVIGQASSLNWFKVRVPDGREGWIADDPTLVQLNGARAAIPSASFRPMTGLVQALELPTGLGELHIANATGQDSLVVLVGDAQPVAAAYVRAGETYAMRGVPDGSYTVLTSEGKDWDGGAFTRTVSHTRWEEPFVFTTSAHQYTVWEISLAAAPVPRTQVPVMTSAAAEFP